MTPTKKIVKMEDIIGKSGDKEPETVAPKKEDKPKKTPKKEIPRGRPKSGRIWKTEKSKFSTIIKSKGLKNSFQRKEELRKKLLQVKEASRAIKAAREEAVEKKKQRRRDNLKKQEENRKKSEIVQVITNTKKLKKMRKKQLRYIEKRDTTTISK